MNVAPAHTVGTSTTAIPNGPGQLARLPPELLVHNVLPHAVEENFLPGFAAASRSTRVLCLELARSIAATACARAIEQARSGSSANVPPLPLATIKAALALIARAVPCTFAEKVDAWSAAEERKGGLGNEAGERIKRAYQEKSTLLDLDDLALDTLPAQLWELVHLERLSLRGNCLEDIPPGLGELTALHHLDLRGNRFRSLTMPQETALLIHLEELHWTVVPGQGAVVSTGIGSEHPGGVQVYFHVQ